MARTVTHTHIQILPQVSLSTKRQELLQAYRETMAAKEEEGGRALAQGPLNRGRFYIPLLPTAAFYLSLYSSVNSQEESTLTVLAVFPPSSRTTQPPPNHDQGALISLGLLGTAIQAGPCCHRRPRPGHIKELKGLPTWPPRQLLSPPLSLGAFLPPGLIP